MPHRVLPAPAPHAQHFLLDPAIVYLNHGSFGACPKPVLESQQRHRLKIEADAMRFYIHDLWPMMDRSRDALGALIHAEPADLVFLPNATTAVATVVNNLKLEPGDELLITEFEYPACENNLRSIARQRGAKVVVAKLPWGELSEEGIVEAIMSQVTDRTRLAMLSLITSATAIRLPIEKLIRELDKRGVRTLLDAAHGPGCVPMDLIRWGAHYTTGNAHKWLCTPKGAAFLHVRPELQGGFRPLVLSNDAMDLAPAIERTGRSAFNHEFDYMGTDDRTAMMSIADAIAFLDSLVQGGVDALMASNKRLCIEARDLLCEMLGTEPLVPDDLLGPLAVIAIPGEGLDARALRQRLFDKHRIESMIVHDPRHDGLMVRVSPQIYNTIEQYRYLGQSLLTELEACAVS